MDMDIEPRLALDTALTTRQAAATHRVPTGFTVATAVLTPAGFILLGASDLVGDPSRRAILGGGGLAFFVVQVALFAALALRWRRNGIVPDPTHGATIRQRWNRLWLTLIGLVGYAAVWAATGRTGWALVYAGAALAVAAAAAGYGRRPRRDR